MRTTLDLPKDLVDKAVKVSNSKNKTETIKLALQNLIQYKNLQQLKQYRGKLNIKIDIDALRQR